LRKLKALDYSYGFAVMIVGLGLYSFYVRELLASLFVFSAIFFVFGLIVLTLFLSWTASRRVALWSRSASRSVLALALARGAVFLAIGEKPKP
jgi:hypothetical protein